MSSQITAIWKAQDDEARFADPQAICDRASAFERTIRRRNIIEFVAGAFVLVLFGSAAIGAAVIGEHIMAALLGLTVLGISYVVWTLWQRGSNLERRPEEPCRTHHKAQLERQRDLLRTVPVWYLGPLVPGILGVYGYVVYRVAEFRGFWVAMEGIWVPLVGTAAFFVFVGWINRIAARRIEQEIDALPE